MERGQNLNFSKTKFLNVYSWPMVVFWVTSQFSLRDAWAELKRGNPPARGIHVPCLFAHRNIALYIATVKLPLWFEYLFLSTVYLVLAYGFCLPRTVSFLPTKTCLNGFSPYRDMKIMTRRVNQSGKKGLVFSSYSLSSCSSDGLICKNCWFIVWCMHT